MALQRQYNVKIYAPDGETLLRTINPGDIAEFPPKFTNRLNGGQGTIQLDLRGDSYKFTDFSEGDVIDFMNIITIESVRLDPDTGVQTERTIFKGFISRYEAYLKQNGTQGVTVSAMGLVTLLSRSYYMDGASYDVTETSVDPGQILRNVIDHFNTVFGGGLINYDATLNDVGTAVTAEYSEQKWLDVVKDTAKLAEGGWGWYLGPDGLLRFEEKPAVPTHEFVMDEHVIDLKVTKNSEKVVNDVRVKHSGGNYDASDATSQENFGTGDPRLGKFSKVISESGLDLAGATLRGDKELDEGATEQVSTRATISGEYDIESIRVGQTCKFKNTREGDTIYGDNLQIVEVVYDGDTATVTLENLVSDFLLEMENFVD